MMEQFGAATAHVAQQVEALVQRLSLCRRAFREGLAEAAALNDAQTGLYRMDVGGAPFHTRTEALHRYGGMLSAMASDDFSHDVDVGGQTFLDRDPRWFPLVMHFLRTERCCCQALAERAERGGIGCSRAMKWESPPSGSSS